MNRTTGEIHIMQQRNTKGIVLPDHFPALQSGPIKYSGRVAHANGYFTKELKIILKWDGINTER